MLARWGVPHHVCRWRRGRAGVVTVRLRRRDALLSGAARRPYARNGWFSVAGEIRRDVRLRAVQIMMLRLGRPHDQRGEFAGDRRRAFSREAGGPLGIARVRCCCGAWVLKKAGLDVLCPSFLRCSGSRATSRYLTPFPPPLALRQQPGVFFVVEAKGKNRMNDGRIDFPQGTTGSSSPWQESPEAGDAGKPPAPPSGINCLRSRWSRHSA
jgi:hypothetical protein